MRIAIKSMLQPSFVAFHSGCADPEGFYGEIVCQDSCHLKWTSSGDDGNLDSTCLGDTTACLEPIDRKRKSCLKVRSFVRMSCFLVVGGRELLQLRKCRLSEWLKLVFWLYLCHRVMRRGICLCHRSMRLLNPMVPDNITVIFVKGSRQLILIGKFISTGWDAKKFVAS